MPTLVFDDRMTSTSTTSDTLSTASLPIGGKGEQRLRRVLRINATTSAISGAVMAVAPGTIDEILDTSYPGWVRFVGLALLPFAAFVAWLASADRSRLELLTPGIVTGDVAWVAASVVTCLLGWYSVTGVLAVAAMAVAVDTFAVLQFISWRRLK